MTLRELVAGLPDGRVVRPHGAPSGADTEICSIEHVADRVEPGVLFACVPGARVDGHDFAHEAVARGASALLVERELETQVPQVVVSDVRLALGIVAGALRGNPSESLSVVAVTGTNGKTTSTYLARAVLSADGSTCGLIGTIGGIVGGVPTPIGHTTPDAIAVHELLAQMRDAGDSSCAMEVSSHALDQSRVAGVAIDVAIFTNLTRDHLDYHADEEDYFTAKRRLFRRPAGEGADPIAVVNVDDAFGARLADEVAAITTSVRGTADVTVQAVGRRGPLLELRAETARGSFDLRTRLRGAFNLSNIAGVIGVGEALCLPHEQVSAGIGSLPGVPGRFEAIDEGQDFEVIVDYAHTPDSLENVLVAGRQLAGDGRLIVVFGCGGDRDRGKRPLMGAATGAAADLAIVTSDNPRTEDPEAIIAEVLGGMSDARAKVAIEPDRGRAIADALAAAGPRDVVLIAGKGHEQGQERDGVVTPFDDRDVARGALRGGVDR